MKIKLLFIVPALLLVACKGKTPTSYKVIYDANGGTFDNGDTTIEVTVPANQPMEEILEIPSRGKDFLFGHWYENKECTGDAFNFSSPITHDMNLYAKWLNNTGDDSDFDGLVNTIDPAPEDNTYTADLLEIYPPIHRVSMPVTVDYRRFVDCEDDKLDKDLEKLGNICAMDIYRESTTTLQGPSKIYEPITGDDDEKLYLQLGCADIESYALDPDEYEIDKFDTYRCILAHHHFTYNSDEYEVLFITNQGTDSEPEWFSDFDVGYDDNNYADVTGVPQGGHTDWINNDPTVTLHHKGFDVATNREYNKVIKPYVSKHINKNAKLIIFNTGHSRGAAIANLLAKIFYDNKDIDIFKSLTYTYATPTTVYNKQDNYNPECKNVFNILNEDDIVPKLPLTKWGYYRYGTDVTRQVSNGHEEEWQVYNDTYFSYTYPDCDDLTKKMLEMAPVIDEVYTPHIDEETKFFEKEYDTEQECKDAIASWQEVADYWYGRNTLDFETTPTTNGTFILRGYNRPVSLMNRLSVVVGNVNELDEEHIERLQLMLGDGTLCDSYQLIEYEFLLNGLGLLTAHRGTTYYFISTKLI